MENKRNLKKMPDILAMLERSNNTAQLAAESLQYAVNVCRDNDANRIHYNNNKNATEAAFKASNISAKQACAAFMASAAIEDAKAPLRI
jgi:hypothetical protein